MKPSPKAGHDIKNSIRSILFPILYTLLILFLALIIYFYANGYRIDVFNQEIKQTGVINVESNITGSELSFNGKIIGRVPKSTSLDVGSYDIKVNSANYYTWEKQAEIVEGKSNTLYAWLIKKDISSKTLWSSAGTLDKYWLNENSGYLIALVKEDNKYSLIRYNSSPVLWDFSSNPLSLAEIDSNDISVSISPNKSQILLTVNTQDQPSYYILSTQTPSTLNDTLLLPIDGSKGYTITWGKDSNYLILNSKSSISSYNIKTKVITNLVTKQTKNSYIWTTDDEGYFYLVEPSTEANNDVYSYNLKQIRLDGTTSQYIIENFYFLKTDSYIKQYRENGFSYVEFSTSPESTLSGGNITSINVDQTAQGMFIKTSLATYWFNMEKQKFMMISAYPADLIEYNKDNEKLIFQDETQYGIFTFEKTEGDYTTDIGSKTIKNISDPAQVSNIQWVNGLDYLIYMENNSIFTIDKDGDNKNQILDTENSIGATITDNRNAIITFTNKDNLFSINEYTIE